MPDPFDGVMDHEALRNLAMTRECAYCRAKSEKLRCCQACRSEWYCGAECQWQHWPRHRTTCRSLMAVVSLAGVTATILLNRASS